MYKNGLANAVFLFVLPILAARLICRHPCFSNQIFLKRLRQDLKILPLSKCLPVFGSNVMNRKTCFTPISATL